LLELLTNGQMSANCNRQISAGELLTGHLAVCKIAQNSFSLYDYYEVWFPCDTDERFYCKTIHCWSWTTHLNLTVRSTLTGS